MHYLIDLCCICLCHKKGMKHLSNSHNNEMTYYDKLASSLSEVCFDEMHYQGLICNDCCDTIDLIYKFHQKCLKNKTIFKDYITKLHLVSNVKGVISVDVVDLNKNKSKENIDITHNEIQMKVCELKTNNNDKTHVEETKENNYSNVKYENVNIAKYVQATYANDTVLKHSEIKTEVESEKIEECIQNNYGYPLKNVESFKIDIEYVDIKMEKDVKIKCEKDDIDEYVDDRTDDILENMNKIDDHPFYETMERPNENQLGTAGIYQDKNELQTHKAIHTAENLYGYNLYNKTYIESNSLPTHFETHKGERLDESLYNETYLSSNGFKYKHVQPIEKPYECSLCNKKLADSATLSTHMQMHTGLRPYQCTVCHKTFAKSSRLTRHMLIHTEEKRHECSICNKIFTKSFHLNRHMLIHTGEKPYECCVCNKKFTESSTLTTHMRIHTGERPHECSICNKTFLTSSNLNRHVLTHSGEKPFECTICNKKFTKSSYLYIHMRIHTGEKPYECATCSKKFIESSSLTKHMRIHTGERPYECSICNRKFNQSSNLHSHMRVYHKVVYTMLKTPFMEKVALTASIYNKQL